MKWLVLFLWTGAFLLSCEGSMEEEPDLEEYDFYKLVIKPENPSSQDLILLMEYTCGIEPDPVISYLDQEITYKRYYNSLMAAPCSPQIDSTIIGPLDAGNYSLVHWVIDKNHMITDSIISVDTLDLVVK